MKVFEMASHNPQIAFSELQRICCQSMVKPSPESFEAFRKAFEKFPSESITPEVSNYLVGAFLVSLKVRPNARESVQHSLFKPLQRLLERCQMGNFTFFFDLFEHLNMVLGTKDGKITTDFNHTLNDEVLRSIVSCLFTLLKHNLPSYREQLFDEKHKPSVGHCIYMQVQIVDHSDTPLDIRLLSIQVVQTLVETCIGTESMCHHIFNFLPGIVKVLRTSASPKVGRLRKALVINSLHLLMTTISTSISFEAPEKLEMVDRNLSVVLKHLSHDLIIHEEDSLRLAILDLSCGIIHESKKKLPNCEEILWKNLLIGCSDNSITNSSRSQQFLIENATSVQEFCDYNNIIQLLKSAKAQFINNNEDESIMSLKCVASSLLVTRLFFLELRDLLFPLTDLLTTAILHNKMDMEETISSTSNLFKPNPFLQTCRFLCRNIAKSVSSVDDIFDEIVPLITQFSQREYMSNIQGRIENNFIGLLYCFNIMLQGLVDEPPPNVNIENYDISSIASTYLEILHSQAILLQIQYLNQNEGPAPTPVAPKILAALEHESMLLIQGLGILASIDTYTILPTVLYSLLEQAGASSLSPSVANVARSTVTMLADKTGSSGISNETEKIRNFLSQNLDLIMSELSVRITSISSNPNCPNALTFLADFFDFAQSDFVSLIESVFAQSCDQFYNTSSLQLYSFTRIFHAFMTSLWNHRKLKPSSKPSSSSRKTACNDQESATICSKLLNYQTAIGIEVSEDKDKSSFDSYIEEIEDEPEALENEVKSNKDEADTNADSDDDDDKNDSGYSSKRLLPELKLSLKICERVLNFLPAANERSVQLASMDCLIIGVQLLKDYENSLLPLAHTIWQNLSPRFKQKDLVVVRKSFELLLALTKCSGNFLRKRVVEEVFPKLSAFLISLVSQSEGIQPKRKLYYTFTQAYKLQMIILEGLAELSMSIELSEEELDQVVSGCLLYVKPEQHKNLQDAAVKVIKSLGESSLGRVVWMKLIFHKIVEPLMQEPPHPDFRPLPASYHLH